MKINFLDSGNPTLHFSNEKTRFDKGKDCYLLNFNYKNIKEKSDENNICKIQNFSDLKRINCMIENLEERIYMDSDSFGINRGFGNKCYFFEENNEIKIKTIKDQEYSKIIDTRFGLMVSVDHGEFGGFLYIITEHGWEIAGFGNYVYVFEYDGKVYAITTLNHMGCFICSLHEIKNYEDRIENRTIFSTYDLDFKAYYIEDNYLYFYSDSEYDGLYRFNLDNNQLEIIHKNLCNQINVNDILKKDDYMYIYGSYTVIKYSLNTKEMEIYTNLEYDEIGDCLYAYGRKLLDIWDMLLDT